MRRKSIIAALSVFAALHCGCATTDTSPPAARYDAEGYVGRYTGGGAHPGEARRAHEGTWARDYAVLFPLRWSHSKEYRQGGRGCY